LVTAFVLIVTGLASSILAVGSLGAVHFGTLNPERSLRLVIPAVLSLTLGFEVMFSSFFLSVLGMKRKGSVVPGTNPPTELTGVIDDGSKRASNQTEMVRAEDTGRPSLI